MDYFAAMRVFVHAVERGSFSKAAEEEDLKVSTVSRYVAALEADLGAALFNRSTRRLHLTEVGRFFYEQATRILNEVSDARIAAASLNARPQGLLRITMPVSFGRRHVFPLLPDFLREYPEIRLDATLSDETVDLIASGNDLAIRIGALADSSLIAKRLAPHRRVLVASPGYLAGRPPVTEPGDLPKHECLPFALQPKDIWYFRRLSRHSDALTEVPVHGRLRTNHSEALLDAVLADLGIALLPTWLVSDALASGTLQALLPAWEGLIAPGPDRAIWGVYPPKKVVPPKVRAFLSFVEQRFGKPPYWEQAIKAAAK
jgi:DNA-binding transcriptional LysR family regulator